MPLVMTGRTSFGEAAQICYGRSYKLYSLRYNATGMDSDHLSYMPDWSMKDDAARALFPMHLNKGIATCVSLAAFLVWMCFSPHADAAVENLDRTCKSCRRVVRVGVGVQV